MQIGINTALTTFIQAFAGRVMGFPVGKTLINTRLFSSSDQLSLDDALRVAHIKRPVSLRIR